MNAAVLPDFPMRRPCPFALPTEYARMRSETPVAPARLPNGQRVWLVSRRTDITAVLTNPAVSSDRAHAGFPFLTAEAEYLRSVRVFVGMDGADHAERRRMFLSEFTTRSVRAIRPRIEADVEARLDAIVSAGPPMELVESLALPVPAVAMGTILGVPDEQSADFETMTVRLLSREVRASGAAGEVFAELVAFMKTLVRAKADEPGDDLISRIVVDHVRVGRMELPELTISLILILLAGYETTANTIALGTFTLLSEPDRWRRLLADPASIPAVVEEMLRYLSVAELATMRVATEDIEIGGAVIPAGEGLIPLSAAGNRDGTFFDRPEEFDPSRSARGHLAFGYGAHACIGANLARAEMEIVFAAMARRLAGLALAGEVEVRYDEVLFGLDSLPVTW